MYLNYFNIQSFHQGDDDSIHHSESLSIYTHKESVDIGNSDDLTEQDLYTVDSFGMSIAYCQIKIDKLFARHINSKNNK